MYYTCDPSEVEGKNVACTHRELANKKKMINSGNQVNAADKIGEINKSDSTNTADTFRKSKNEECLDEAEHVFYVDYLENKISIKWIIDEEKLLARDFVVDFSDRKETVSLQSVMKKHEKKTEGSSVQMHKTQKNDFLNSASNM